MSRIFSCSYTVPCGSFHLFNVLSTTRITPICLFRTSNFLSSQILYTFQVSVPTVHSFPIFHIFSNPRNIHHVSNIFFPPRDSSINFVNFLKDPSNLHKTPAELPVNVNNIHLQLIRSRSKAQRTQRPISPESCGREAEERFACSAFG